MRATFLAVALLGIVGGCVVPTKLEEVDRESLLRADCQCTVCLMPQGVGCAQTGVNVLPEFACGQDTNHGLSLPLLKRACQETQNSLGAGTTCDLNRIHPGDTTDEEKIVTHELHADVCPDTSATGRSVPLTTQPGDARVTIDPGRSFVRLTSPNATAFAKVAGSLSFSGGNCSDSSCPVSINWLSLRPENTDLHLSDGSTVRLEDTFIFNERAIHDSFSSDSHGALFSLPPGSTELHLSTTADGSRRGLNLTNTEDHAGGVLTYDRGFLFETTGQSDDYSVDVVLVGTVQNYSPHVSAPPTITTECTGSGGAMVTIPAAIEDVDGGPAGLRVFWTLDGAAVTQSTATPTLFVPLGTHVVMVRVVDADGGFAQAQTLVTVKDSGAPVVSLTPVCLWPPNHELYSIDGADLVAAGLVKDSCDPNPVVTFSNPRDSQPDNAIGDGNTTDDIRVGDSAVCVRAERQGVVLSGRTYFVDVTATDHSGNSTTVTQQITVPHDESGAGCEKVQGEPIESIDDAQCISKVKTIPPSSTANAPSTQGGCSMGGDAGTAPAALLGLIALIWYTLRRRRNWS